MTQQTLTFQAEISRLLDLITNSLYSDKSIFLRELISNAADACDKLRYTLLTHPGLVQEKDGFKIFIEPDEKNKTLTISDNGIGMNEKDLIENLGTIAHSGSLKFLQEMTTEGKKDLSLIGQFGVGFYSAFMVADKVDVLSEKAGEKEAYLWTSDGKGSFSVSDAPSFGHGTKIILHLKEEDSLYASAWKVRELVKKYSDHVLIPVILKHDGKEERLNEAQALWMKNKAEITKEEYRDFYRHLSFAMDDPWDILHFKAEGVHEYTGLLFIPTQAPFDLFQPDRKSKIKLYTNRVFISDDLELLPPYLRFVKGLIDTNDLPLNVSREILQTTPVLAMIKNALTNRVLKELAEKQKDKKEYLVFWKTFGPVLKEGLYEDGQHRSQLAELCLFYSARKKDFISLKDYLSDLKKGQKSVYYLTGDSLESLKSHPLLEAYEQKGVDVLLLTEPVDEFWPQMLASFEEHPFVNILKDDSSLKEIEDDSPENKENSKEEPLSEEKVKLLLHSMKEVLKDEVKDIRPTDKLRHSPVLLVSDSMMSLRLERLMKASNAALSAAEKTGLILQINPTSRVIKKLAELADCNEKKAETADKNNKDRTEKEKTSGATKEQTQFENAVWLLYFQARLTEGEEIKDPSFFAQKLDSFLQDEL
jgi:molecular chaperone HtpG